MTTQTTLRLPAELKAALDEMAEETGLTVTSLLVAAIWQHVLKPNGRQQS